MATADVYMHMLYCILQSSAHPIRFDLGLRVLRFHNKGQIQSRVYKLISSSIESRLLHKRAGRVFELPCGTSYHFNTRD